MLGRVGENMLTRNPRKTVKNHPTKRENVMLGNAGQVALDSGGGKKMWEPQRMRKLFKNTGAEESMNFFWGGKKIATGMRIF